MACDKFGWKKIEIKDDNSIMFDYTKVPTGAIEDILFGKKNIDELSNIITNVQYRNKIKNNIEYDETKPYTQGVIKLRNILKDVYSHIDYFHEKFGGNKSKDDLTRLTTLAISELINARTSQEYIANNKELSKEDRLKVTNADNDMMIPFDDVAEVVGRKFAMSKGMVYYGTAKQRASNYRAIGNVAIRMLEKAGYLTIKDGYKINNYDGLLTNNSKTPIDIHQLKTIKSKVVDFDDKMFDLTDNGLSHITDITKKEILSNINRASGAINRIFTSPNYSEPYKNHNGRVNTFYEPGKSSKELLNNFKDKPYMEYTQSIKNFTDKILDEIILDEDSFKSNPEAYMRELDRTDPILFKNIFGVSRTDYDFNAKIDSATGKIINRYREIGQFLYYLKYEANVGDKFYGDFVHSINDRVTQINIGNYQTSKFVRGLSQSDTGMQHTTKSKTSIINYLYDVVDELGFNDVKKIFNEILNGDLNDIAKKNLDNKLKLNDYIAFMHKYKLNNIGEAKKYIDKISEILPAINKDLTLDSSKFNPKSMVSLDVRHSGMTLLLLDNLGFGKIKDIATKLGLFGDMPRSMKDGYEILSNAIDNVYNFTEANTKIATDEIQSKYKIFKEAFKPTLDLLYGSERQFSKSPSMRNMYGESPETTKTSLAKEMADKLIATKETNKKGVLAELERILKHIDNEDAFVDIETNRGSKSYATYAKELLNAKDKSELHNILTQYYKTSITDIIGELLKQELSGKNGIFGEYNGLIREIGNSLDNIKKLIPEAYGTIKTISPLKAIDNGVHDTKELINEIENGDYSKYEKSRVVTEKKKTFIAVDKNGKQIVLQKYDTNTPSLSVVNTHRKDAYAQLHTISDVANDNSFIQSIHDNIASDINSMDNAIDSMNGHTLDVIKNFSTLENVYAELLYANKLLQDKINSIPMEQRGRLDTLLQENEKLLNRVKEKVEANRAEKAKINKLKNILVDEQKYNQISDSVQFKEQSIEKEVRKKVYNNIPDEVKNVKVVADNTIEHGYYDEKADEIHYNPYLSKEEQLDTLLHEFRHAAINHFINSSFGPKGGKLKNKNSLDTILTAHELFTNDSDFVNLNEIKQTVKELTNNVVSDKVLDMIMSDVTQLFRNKHLSDKDAVKEIIATYTTSEIHKVAMQETIKQIASKKPQSFVLKVISGLNKMVNKIFGKSSLIQLNNDSFIKKSNDLAIEFNKQLDKSIANIHSKAIKYRNEVNKIVDSPTMNMPNSEFNSLPKDLRNIYIDKMASLIYKYGIYSNISNRTIDLIGNHYGIILTGTKYNRIKQIQAFYDKNKAISYRLETAKDYLDLLEKFKNSKSDDHFNNVNTVMNNFAATVTNKMIGLTIENDLVRNYIDEKLSKYQIYNTTKKTLTNIANSELYQKIEATMNPFTHDYDFKNTMLTVLSNAQQERINGIINKENEIRNAIKTDGLTKEEHNLLAKTLISVPFTNVVKTMHKLVGEFGSKRIDDNDFIGAIQEKINKLSSSKKQAIQILINTFMNKSNFKLENEFDIMLNKLDKNEQELAGAIISLTVLEKNGNLKEIADILDKAPNVAKMIEMYSISTDSFMKNLKLKSPQLIKTNGVNHRRIIDTKYEINAVNYNTYLNKNMEKDGWSIIDGNRSNNSLVIIKRLRTNTFQGGLYSGETFKEFNIYIPNEDARAILQQDKNAPIIKVLNNFDNEQYIINPKYVNELNDIGFDDSLDKVLARNNTQLEYLNKINTVHDAILSHRMKILGSIDDVIDLSKQIKFATVEKNGEYPWFIKFENKNIDLFEKLPDDIKNKYTSTKQNGEMVFIRKDLKDEIQGYTDIETQNRMFNVFAHYWKQGIMAMKLHSVVVNTSKQLADMASNISAMIILGIGPIEFKKRIGEANKKYIEFGKLRKKLEEERFKLSYLKGIPAKYQQYVKQKEKVDNLFDKVKKHQLYGLSKYGFVQNQGVTLEFKDFDTISGLERTYNDTLDFILGGATKDEYNKLGKLFSALSTYGVKPAQLIAALGKTKFSNKIGLKNYMFDMAERLSKASNDGDAKAIVKDLVAAPDSSVTKLFSASMHYIDNIPRHIVYEHLIENKGMDKEEAAKLASSLFVDYRPNMPKEVKALSDVGIIMYPSYWIRMLRSVYSLMRIAPVSSTAQLGLASYYNHKDMSIVASNNPFTRNIFPVDTPFTTETILPVNVLGF